MARCIFFSWVALQVHTRSPDQTALARSGGAQRELRCAAQLYVCLQFLSFFDFAGYSAFAISVSYFFGIHTPENFRRPFLARNIRDFWNRWHITLSFWFRDHVYMRFLLAAGRGRWFKSMHTAAILGYFLAFGLMGAWHGLEPHYIIYGLYQATLLSAFHIFSTSKNFITTGVRAQFGTRSQCSSHSMRFASDCSSFRDASVPHRCRRISIMRPSAYT